MKRSALAHEIVFSDEDYANNYAKKHKKMVDKFGQEYSGKLTSRGFNKGRIIDVGFGFGGTAIVLAKDFPESKVFGIDLSEPLLGLAAVKAIVEGPGGSYAGDNPNASRRWRILAEKGRGKRVAIVGHFPFIAKLRERAKDLWVIEENPRAGDFPEHEAEDLIPKANVVGLTGTALTNHTLEHLLELCQPGAYVVVLGDTAPLSPILFSYGIDAVSSTKVVSPELALRCISEGANFRQIKGTQRLTMVKETFY